MHAVSNILSACLCVQYGGNPVSCAVANAVMDVIEKEQLQAHALQVGQEILAGYAELEKKHVLVGDIR